ncbi:YhcN/YlaJ family sporulation lipoprotein [Bacillus sp. DJP31]|uniref:YhcN/YlaJ family sporulation lipoprotein n=1 Tax=Bacillus sp. DJP31 TaxID=3409789 RepID=UPI003BB5D398
MNKKVLYTLSTAFLLSSLTACGGNDDEGAMGTNNTNAARPIGYYSNENVNPSNGNSERNGNARLPERDNDGPVTEMLDRTSNNNSTNGRHAGNIGTRDDGIVGEDHDRMGVQNVRTNRKHVNEANKTNRGDHKGQQDLYGRSGTYSYGQYASRGSNGHSGNNGPTTLGGNGQNSNRNSVGDYGNNIGVNNPTRPKATEDRGMARDNRYSRSDYNYHGQMMGQNNNAKASYKNNYNGGLAEKISNRVKDMNNVDDARTIVNGNEILVAVDTKNQNDRDVEQKVRSAIRSMTSGKEVRVVTDESTFTRARNIDNELRNGGPTDNLDADVRDMFKEIGQEIDDESELR